MVCANSFNGKRNATHTSCRKTTLWVCTIKDDKSLNGRTQGHPMLKSKPRLM
jgi:hypothetical protein